MHSFSSSSISGTPEAFLHRSFEIWGVQVFSFHSHSKLRCLCVECVLVVFVLLVGNEIGEDEIVNCAGVGSGSDEIVWFVTYMFIIICCVIIACCVETREMHQSLVVQ